MSEDSRARKVVRAVWNGPFYIGKLAQPVSTGDAILKLLETVWRITVVVVLVPSLGIGLLVAWVGWIGPIINPPLSKQVTIMVHNDWSKVEPPTITTGKPFKCPQEYPLQLWFGNESSKTVRKVSFSIEATEPDHSTDLWDGDPFIDSDGVMAPKTGWRACYRATVKEGHDPANLFFVGKISYAEE